MLIGKSNIKAGKILLILFFSCLPYKGLGENAIFQNNSVKTYRNGLSEKQISEDELIELIKNKKQIICHAEDTEYNFAGNWDIDERDRLFCNYQQFLSEEDRDKYAIKYESEDIQNFKEDNLYNEGYIEFIEDNNQDMIFNELEDEEVEEKNEGNYIEFIEQK